MPALGLTAPGFTLGAALSQSTRERPSAALPVTTRRIGRSPWSAMPPCRSGAVQAAVGCGEVQAREAIIAECHSHRHVRGRGMRLDDRAARRENVDQRARPALGPAAARDEIALGIDAYSFD